MANQSLVSLPTDLSDEVVLRRVLSLIIEQLDIALGNKEGATNVFSRQEAIIEELTKANDELLAVVTKLAEDTSNNIKELQYNSYFSSFSVDFSYTDNVVINKSRNVSGGTRVSTGVYTFKVVPNSNNYSYFVSNREVQARLINSSTLEIRVYRNESLVDPTDNISVAGMYVPN